MTTSSDQPRSGDFPALGPAFDALPLPAAAIDGEEIVVAYNKAFGGLFGTPRLGHRLTGLDFAWSAALGRASRGGPSEAPPEPVVIAARSGQPVEARIYRVPVRVEGRDVELVLVVPLQATADESRQAVGTVAHDLNNALAVILSAAKMASQSERIEDSREDIDTIIESVAHASRLTAQLTALSSRRSGDTIDLNRLLRDMESVLRTAVGNAARLELDVWPEATPVSGNRTQLEQLIVNLVINARDATAGEGGVIRVSTHCGNQGESHLVVSDDGAGMHPWVQERIFDPYFTTKPVGLGTGLGLSTLRQLLMAGDVDLDLKTAPNAGSRFDIAFKRPVENDERRIGPAQNSAWDEEDSTLYRRYSELTFDSRVSSADYWSGESSSVTPV